MQLVKPNYKTISPKSSGQFEFQWNDCLDKLTEYIHHPDYKIFRICVFIHVESESDFELKSGTILSEITLKNAGVAMPVSVIPQSPEEPFVVSIELGLIEKSAATVNYIHANELVYSAVTSVEGIQECWMVGAMSDTVFDGRHNPAIQAFEKVKSGLDNAGLSFNAVVRQWNYVGRILDICGSNGSQIQNYQLFNETRNKQYSQFRSISGFPAATGIGMNSGRVAIECMTINSDVVQVIAVSNPNQKESYHYGQEVLVGELKVQKQPPQFERAILLRSGKTSRLIISGTASIVGQQTIGIGDVELQTKITIDNIEKLTSVSNLKAHCPDLINYPDIYNYLRVYVKNRIDIQKVKQICSDHFGNVPVTYIQADICRNDLLVEIEAEKINVG